MKKRIVLAGVLLTTFIAAWLGAQALTPVKPPAELMPPGALFYVEARNFAKLLSAWETSPERKTWLASASYQSFTRSHLLTRLAEARKSFTDAAGLPESASLLSGVAGGESAVAVYHIGKLEFLYMTEIPAARFADSALGRVKQKFEARKAGGRDYFVLSKGDNTIAFALVNERLILATREDLIAASLKLIAGEKIGTLHDERWFTETLAKAPVSTAPDVRFIADLSRVSRTPQFRWYWIQRNFSELSQFASEVDDLKFSAADVREDRVLLRREVQESQAAAESAVAELMRFAIADAGFYQAIAKPSPADVADMLAQKVFGHGKPLERQFQNKAAPEAPQGPLPLGEDDFETRVDVPPVAEDSDDLFAPLAALAANTDAMLQTGLDRTTGVLPSIDAAVVLHGVSPWKLADVRRVLGQVAGSVWSVAAGSLEWSDRNGYSELNGANPLRIAVDGKALVISLSPEWTARTLAGHAAGHAASYAASVRFAQEMPAFTRMTRLLDFPSVPQSQQGDAAREPLFFSENIVSLLGSMVRLDSATITAHDTGAMVTETVEYRKK